MTRLRIKELAEARGLNKSRLQLQSQVTMPLLRRYWENDTESVELVAIGKIARALGVRSGELFEDEEA